jgi:hypothetical protein
MPGSYTSSVPGTPVGGNADQLPEWFMPPPMIGGHAGQLLLVQGLGAHPQHGSPHPVREGRILDRAYATFMKSAMNAIERYALQSAEREPGPDDSRLPGEAHNHGSPPARNSPRH